MVSPAVRPVRRKGFCNVIGCSIVVIAAIIAGGGAGQLWLPADARQRAREAR
jgi:hypothetical protein